jgi:hypothetical protein
MKSTLAILSLALVCLWGQEVKADTVLDISATCDPIDINCALDLQAQITVRPVTGLFFNPDGLFFFTGTQDEVLTMTGTLNGDPVSYSPNSPSLPAPSWVVFGPSIGGPGVLVGLPGGFDVGDLQFSVGGVHYTSFNFGGHDVLFSNDNNTSGIVDYTATVVGTPEPPLFVLLATGLLGLGWRRLKGRARTAADVPNQP